jgi:hypothetical protein
MISSGSSGPGRRFVFVIRTIGRCAYDCRRPLPVGIALIFFADCRSLR